MSRVHILTWAQSRTPVHAPFWRNLTAYARNRQATIHVMQGRYKHLNNPFDEGESSDDEWWAPEVMPYAHAHREEVGPNVLARFDTRISPTAANPLSGFQMYEGNNSCVFGHPRYHMRTLPAGHRRYPKIQCTTGACTIENYSETKAGSKAHENHIFGFVIVEIDGDYFHLRHVNAQSRTGDFIDAARGVLVQGGKVKRAPPAQCLRVGDAHAFEQYEPAIQATLAMQKRCRALRTIVDDIYSHSAAGHRLERSDYQFQLKKFRRRFGVEDELRQACDLIDRLNATDVMDSNHHHHLEQWLRDSDGRDDPENLLIWARLLTRKAADPDQSLFEAYYRDHTGRADVNFFQRGELCVIGDVVHDHGHEGINGARGSISQFRRFGSRITTGHTHSPSATDGHYCTGHISDPAAHSYADPTKSTWLWANVIQDAFSKRQIVAIIPDSSGLYTA